MKKIMCIIISVSLVFLVLFSTTKKVNNTFALKKPSVKIPKKGTDKTVTGSLHLIARENNFRGKVLPGINLIIIDANGKIVGRTKTGKNGIADIKVKVPIDKRYNSETGTATVIGYNNDKYIRTILYEVPVNGASGLMGQQIFMISKTGYRDEEVNICFGNIYHMLSINLADKYVHWNSK